VGWDYSFGQWLSYSAAKKIKKGKKIVTASLTDPSKTQNANSVHAPHRLTILSLLQRPGDGSRLKGQLLKLSGHRLAPRARDQDWRRGDFHATGT